MNAVIIDLNEPLKNLDEQLGYLNAPYKDEIPEDGSGYIGSFKNRRVYPFSRIKYGTRVHAVRTYNMEPVEGTLVGIYYPTDNLKERKIPIALVEVDKEKYGLPFVDCYVYSMYKIE